MMAKRDRGTRDRGGDDRDYERDDGPRRYYRRGNGRYGNGQRGGFMASASPAATLGLVMGVLGLGINVATIGYIYASVLAEQQFNRKEIERNYREDVEARAAHAKAMEDRIAPVIKSVERLDVTIGGMGKLQTEMELVKFQLTTINGTLQDLKRTFERTPMHHMNQPAAAGADRRR